MLYQFENAIVLMANNHSLLNEISKSVTSLLILLSWCTLFFEEIVQHNHLTRVSIYGRLGRHVGVVWAVHPERKISYSEYEIHNNKPIRFKGRIPSFLVDLLSNRHWLLPGLLH